MYLSLEDSDNTSDYQSMPEPSPETRQNNDTVSLNTESFKSWTYYGVLAYKAEPRGRDRFHLSRREGPAVVVRQIHEPRKV